MAESINFQSILIVSILAFATPVIITSFKRLHIPFVVGEIIVGILVGKSFLNLVNNDSWMIFLSDLGLAHLMFASGLEIDFNQFKTKENYDKNKRKLYISGVMLLISLLIVFGKMKVSQRGCGQKLGPTNMVQEASPCILVKIE